jgi:hypothetical protein
MMRMSATNMNANQLVMTVRSCAMRSVTRRALCVRSRSGLYYFQMRALRCPECGVVVQRVYLRKHCKRYHDLNGENAREVDGIARRASRQYDQRLAQWRLASQHRQWDPPPHSRMMLDEGDVVESRNVDDPIVASAPSLTIAQELGLDVIDASRCVCPSPGCDWPVGLIYLRDHLKRWCDHSRMLSAGYRADLEKVSLLNESLTRLYQMKRYPLGCSHSMMLHTYQAPVAVAAKL